MVSSLLPCYTHIWFSIYVCIYIHMHICMYVFRYVCFCAPLFYATNSFFPLRHIHTQFVVVVNQKKRKANKLNTLLLLLPPCQRMMKIVCVCVCTMCTKQNLKINNMANCVWVHVCALGNASQTQLLFATRSLKHTCTLSCCFTLCRRTRPPMGAP